MTTYKYELTGATLVVGILTFIVMWTRDETVAIALIAAIGLMALYLGGARASVAAYDFLSRWAYKGSTPGVSTSEQALMVILWPVCAPLALVLYPIMGVVNRTFPDA